MAFGNYQAGQPKQAEFTVPAGDYNLRVVEAIADTSKTGNDMVKMKLRVIKDDGTEGPALFDYLVFSTSSFWKIDAFLKSCGKHPGDGGGFPFVPDDMTDSLDDMIGLECRGTLTVEEYQGRKSNKVGAYLFDAEEDFS
jgi:hypothetical protein